MLGAMLIAVGILIDLVSILIVYLKLVHTGQEVLIVVAMAVVGILLIYVGCNIPDDDADEEEK